MKNNMNNRIKKDFDDYYENTMKILNTKVLKILDICSAELHLMKMKMKMDMKISDICLMKMKMKMLKILDIC